MKIVGLTGGIGSGKTTIAEWFLQKGIPVYNSDIRAKQLMNDSPTIRENLIQLFGEEAYENQQLNRKFISSQVFKDKHLLEELNRIVHPAVSDDFHRWANKQSAPFLVKEAAILFESGSYRDCDYVISVVAEEESRINRVIARDHVSSEHVLSIIHNQWTDELRIVNSDFVIRNNSGLQELKQEFEKVYKKLLKKTNLS